MVNKRQTAIFAVLIIAVAATIASGAMYVLSNQPTEQTDESLTFGDSQPDSMPGLETRPENQTNDADGPQL